MRRAFTMLEVLIALTIVILLAALLMPVFNRARGRSHITVCTSNLKQIYYALQLYRNDHGAYPKNSFHWSYWGGPGSDKVFKQMPCPAWKSFGCRFAENDVEVPPPRCEWWPYLPLWDGLWVTSETGESKEPWSKCRDSRGDALPIATDENHTLNVQRSHTRATGAPYLILREGGQVTVHQTPLPHLERFADPECPYGSPFNY